MLYLDGLELCEQRRINHHSPLETGISNPSHIAEIAILTLRRAQANQVSRSRHSSNPLMSIHVSIFSRDQHHAYLKV